MATFEDNMHELEEIVRKLETGELPLEESLAAFERGTALSRLCKSELDKVEARIQVVTRGPGGEDRVEDLAMAVAEGEEDEYEEEE